MEHDAAAYKQWRKRLERAQEAEDRAWEELSGASLFARAVRHDLSPFEQTELTTQLARYRNVARAWLVRKQLREFPRRRAYLLFVEMPGLEPDEGLALCHRLENSLSMPGPMLVMDADEASSPEELKRHAAEPVFVR